MAMNHDTAELLLVGAVQVADDIPGIGPHARPAEMCKKGYLVDLRDGNTRVISDQQTKASIQQESRNRGIRAPGNEQKGPSLARLLATGFQLPTFCACRARGAPCPQPPGAQRCSRHR
jgi:hypothetical protein